MSLRLRLAFVLFLLAAVPLAAIVVTSHLGSRRALREAAEVEAGLMAREMELRVASAATGVGRRLDRLRELPAEVWLEGRSEDDRELSAVVLAQLGDAFPFFGGLEFVPAPEARAARPVRPAAREAAPPLPPLPPIPKVAVGDLDSHALAVQLARVSREVARALAATEGVRIEIARHAVRSPGEVAAAAAVAEPAPPPAPGEVAPPPGPVAVAPPPPGEAGRQVLRGEYACEVRSGDRVVGELRARVRARELVGAVLAATRADQGEIPFAIDAEQQIHAASPEHAARLAAIPGLRDASSERRRARGVDDWVVVTREDPATGLRFGIARPLAEPLRALRRATARSLGFGVGLIGLALVGVVPLAGRMTRNLAALTAGAERLAAGELDVRVPVRSADEVGRLAATFNRMAGQIEEHRRALVEQEKRRKEEEIARRLLAAENERRGRELEEARQFQLSLLPRALPEIAGLEVAVSMETATEVGGDYYDAQVADDGEAVVAIGDATGHGAAAGTMVTVVKSLFICEGTALSAAAFLERANAQVQRMALGRMAMALTVLRLSGRRVRLAAAGMPPALWWRAATREVVEIAFAATPLGALAGATYGEREVELAPGDALLLTSDGFPELVGEAGEPLGYEEARARFAAAAAAEGDAEALVARLRREAAAWHGARPLADDITFLLFRAR
ncbi:MAG: SpoIIE family protein phosphatase [Thermoanaerobaculia bacterium]|nr:SpoIIE family protein phosphatase [Thermoanaerobaculia bacterium]